MASCSRAAARSDLTGGSSADSELAKSRVTPARCRGIPALPVSRTTWCRCARGRRQALLRCDQAPERERRGCGCPNRHIHAYLVAAGRTASARLRASHARFCWSRCRCCASRSSAAPWQAATRAGSVSDPRGRREGDRTARSHIRRGARTTSRRARVGAGPGEPAAPRRHGPQRRRDRWRSTWRRTSPGGSRSRNRAGRRCGTGRTPA